MKYILLLLLAPMLLGLVFVLSDNKVVDITELEKKCIHICGARNKPALIGDKEQCFCMDISEYKTKYLGRKK